MWKKNEIKDRKINPKSNSNKKYIYMEKYVEESMVFSNLSQIEIFFWRDCFNTLSAKVLAICQILFVHMCPLCHREYESNIHVRWFC